MSNFAAARVHHVGSVANAFRIPQIKKSPYDVGRLKIFYPAQQSQGVIWEPSPTDTPRPVVIFLGAGFTEATRYQWLAESVVRQTSACFVTTDRVGEPFGTVGHVANAEMTSDGSGAVPYLTALTDLLGTLNAEGALAGLLDLERVVLGGHSFGARDALMNGYDERLPNVKGVFSYGAHAMARKQHGCPSPPIMDLKGMAPLMLMGGSDDQNVMRAGPTTFGTEWKTPMEPMERTFHEALLPERPAFCVEFDGFNHFSFVDPLDYTMGPLFQVCETKIDRQRVHDAISKVVSLFVLFSVFDDEKAKTELKNLAQDENSLVSNVLFKE